MEKQILDKLKKIIEKGMAKGRNEIVLQSVAAYGSYLYKEREIFTSEYLEHVIGQMCELYSKKKIPFVADVQKNVILFYDGFGMDMRGLAIIYLKALAELGYKIIYVTNARAKGKQPMLFSVLQPYEVDVRYFTYAKGYSDQLDFLLDIFEKERPFCSFIYTRPEDVAAVMAFKLCDFSKRYLINLTDDVFWLGITCFDYCIEFRSYGFDLSRKYRKIPENKLVILPFYPYIDRSKEFEGFPIDISDKRLIFSGGALYKTFSEDNLYYRLVSDILRKYSDTVFLYAGYGDNSRLKKLSAQFPGRVFQIDERKDLYQVLKHSFIYINTYPVSGGLMTQYAAAAGILPITLYVSNECEGLLLNQEKTGIFSKSYKDLIAVVDRIFTDDDYRKERQDYVASCLISGEEFKETLQQIIRSGRSKFTFEDISADISKESYTARYKMELFETCVGTYRNRKLIRYFPGIYIKRIYHAVLRKVKRN